MIDLSMTPDRVRDAARLVTALRDGDADPLEDLVVAATADPGHFLGGAIGLLLTVRDGDRDTGVVLHERASEVIAFLERRDLDTHGGEA